MGGIAAAHPRYTLRPARPVRMCDCHALTVTSLTSSWRRTYSCARAMASRPLCACHTSNRVTGTRWPGSSAYSMATLNARATISSRLFVSDIVLVPSCDGRGEHALPPPMPCYFLADFFSAATSFVSAVSVSAIPPNIAASAADSAGAVGAVGNAVTSAAADFTPSTS